ncbi:hypothetical protein BEL04_14535 [Mucilaginibacter sp. PPCGB 2223]|uniref:hypothetical protein n=1 Tax=Mucilaginibacter sp. PPCGB 2223 TaxID=1886027 RepID=UPI0008255E54|nr:hypothetical protein [Mucilaginibacter sp. PPCGB 2223]OCX52660.1 hypothetical protein BEL04_14535 [Mucilaginibacter sp. PPCGB 2223]
MRLLTSNRRDTTQRITQRENRTYGIVSFDEDNAYPQRIYSLTNSAPTARTCVDTYSRFIGGSGFADVDFYQAIANSENQTMDKVLALVKKDLARFRGFALHINVNAAAKITEVFHVPFEHVRMASENRKNESGFDFATYADWSREKRNNIRTDLITWFHAFNLSVDAIAQQVESVGGWGQYKGQLLYVSLDEHSYPLASCDAVLESLYSEIQSDIRTTANLQNNFSAKTMMVHKGKFADDEDRDDFEQGLQEFIGPEGADIIVVDVEKDEEVPELIAINNNANDAVFEYTDTKITNKIIRNWLIPKVLLSVTDGSAGFFNQEQIRDATMYYNMVTIEERILLESVFRQIGQGFYQSINPSDNYAITPIEFKLSKADPPQSLVQLLNNQYITNDSKRNILTILYGVDAEDALKIFPQ